jgi:hypothetical protein
MEAHETIDYEVEEKVRLRGAAPAVDASPQQVALLTDQLADMSTKYQEALTAAASDAERTRLAEWDTGLPRSDWPSRISLGSATISPPWLRPTRKWRTSAIG